jgi:diamine N-acetyltransferase
MAMAEIRRANKDDYDSLVPLFRQVHEIHVNERPDLYKKNLTPVGRELYLSQINDEKQHIYVASEGIVIIAVAVMKMVEISDNPFMKDRRVLFIDSLCVDETKRNTGIGKRLMNFIIEFGKNLQVDSLELGVSERNSSAIKFYESIGLTTKSRKMEIKLN